MFTNWLTHCAVARSLDDRLRDALITAAWTQERDEVTLSLQCGDNELFLQISCAPRAACCFVKSGVARARRNTLDVLDSVIGRRIHFVRIAEDDRVLGILLDDGTMLFVLLHGARANVVHVAAGGDVLSAFKHLTNDLPRPDAWTLEPSPPDEPAIALALTGNADRTTAAALRTLRPWLSGACTAEVLHRGGVDADAACGGLPPDVAVRVADAVAALALECRAGSWHVYAGGDDAILTSLSPDARDLPREATARAVAPCALTHLGEVPVLRFEDASEALWLFVRRRGREDRTGRLRARVERALAAEAVRLERLVTRIETPAELERRGDLYERYGSLLMINLTRAPEQSDRMTVDDLFTDPRLVVSIPLDPRLGVLENAERYFDKARSARGAAAHAGDRAAAARARLERVRAFAQALVQCADTRALQDLFTGYTDLMASLGLTPKGDTNEQPFPFRRFVVSGGFEVWAGKSSANNDELTVRWAKPHDLWFHARGVGGSHVIIRAGSAPGEPTKEAIREAAAIAAYYSKHRNAKSVPVAYTEKKYVRKPKGVPAGTVYLEREKVIMVAPALPASAEEE